MNDYSVHEDGQRIGRIRFASERSPGLWFWTVTVHIPSPPFGSAKEISTERSRPSRHRGWRSSKHGEAALAAAYRAMNKRWDA